MQIISERGGGQPQRRGDSSKRAHVDLTLCGPARGSMMPMHWAFAGTKNLHDFCKGTDHTWDLTAKGWSTLTSWLVWAREFVKHMKSKGLTKALFFCDNASLHMAEEVIEIFAKHNIMLVGLPPATTHKMQPLDVGYIQNVKAMMRNMSGKKKLLF